MAKKKGDPHAESSPHKPVHDNETQDESPAEKLKRLKALNALLLKETVERRQQVDSLTKSNGNLKSELNRSVMDNGVLQSEKNGWSDKAVMLEIEKRLVSDFVIGQVNQLAEERIGSLKEEKSEKESEIRDLKRRVDELLAEIDEERVVSSRVCGERDEIRALLGATLQEVNELKLKVTEAEKTEAQISEEVIELKADLDRLVNENTVNMQRIDSITGEKNLIQEKLVESNGQIDDLKKNIGALLEEKKVIEDEKNSHERKNQELQTMVGELKDLIESMKIDEIGLLEKITDLEKKYATSSESEVILQKQIDGLVEEKKETDELIESLEIAKNSVVKEFEDAMKELEQQKLKIEQIVQEKTELEEARVQGESEIVKMKEQLTTFQDTISSLESSTIDQDEKFKQLEVEVSHYKASLDQATIERDEALKALKEQEAIKTDFQNKITEMEKEIEDLHDLENKYAASSENEVIMQKQINGLIEEKKVRDERIESLENEKDSVQKELQDAMKELEQQKLKIEQIVQEKTELQEARVQGESEIVKMKEQLTTFQDTISSLESSTIDQDEKFKQLEVEVSHYKASLDQAAIERDEALKALKEQEAIKTDFQNKITEMEKEIEDLHDLENKYATSSENEVIMQKQINGLIEEKKVRDERIESLENEKDSIQKELQDAMKELEHQKHTIEQIVQEKTELEDAKIQGESEIVKMKEQFTASQDTISSLESSIITQNQKLQQLEVEVSHYKASLDQNTIEKDEIIKSLENEKSLVLKDLQDAMKEVEHQKLSIEQIVQEKTGLEDAKIQQETEIGKMKEQLMACQDTISSLESSTINQNQKLQQFEEEVSHYKASFDQATIEREEALKTLDEKEAIKTDFQHKITEMEKEIKDLHEDLTRTTTENSKNLAEKNKLEDRCADLAKNMAVLETKLEETRVEFDETKTKFGLAEANSKRVLRILKKTLSGSDKTRDLDLGNGMEEEEIKDHATEVEEIKRVFKEKESRVEEMKRELELVKSSADEVRKEKSFWAYVSSATTLLAAAVSVAYVARAN